MRKKWQNQMPLMHTEIDHPQARELEAISKIIKKNPNISEYVLQDLSNNERTMKKNGAEGMSADQVLRCAIVKTLFGFTYEQLAFHIIDSKSIRRFCHIGIADKGFENRRSITTLRPCPIRHGRRSTRICLDMQSKIRSKKAAKSGSIARLLRATFIFPQILPFCGMELGF